MYQVPPSESHEAGPAHRAAAAHLRRRRRGAQRAQVPPPPEPPQACAVAAAARLTGHGPHGGRPGLRVTGARSCRDCRGPAGPAAWAPLLRLLGQSPALGHDSIDSESRACRSAAAPPPPTAATRLTGRLRVPPGLPGDCIRFVQRRVWRPLDSHGQQTVTAALLQ